MKCPYLDIFYLTIQIICIWAACPIEDDPVGLSGCVSLDLTAIAFVARGKDGIQTICDIANRWMECVKTYSRGCVGFFV